MNTIDEAVDAAKKKHIIKVEVNKKTVTLDGKQHTGLEIKQAAIAEGVEIEIGFQLTLKTGDEWKVIGDSEVIEVKEGDKFRAVHGDDNS